MKWLKTLDEPDNKERLKENLVSTWLSPTNERKFMYTFLGRVTLTNDYTTHLQPGVFSGWSTLLFGWVRCGSLSSTPGPGPNPSFSRFLVPVLGVTAHPHPPRQRDGTVVRREGTARWGRPWWRREGGGGDEGSREWWTGREDQEREDASEERRRTFGDNDRRRGPEGPPVPLFLNPPNIPTVS